TEDFKKNLKRFESGASEITFVDDIFSDIAYEHLPRSLINLNAQFEQALVAIDKDFLNNFVSIYGGKLERVLLEHFGSLHPLVLYFKALEKETYSWIRGDSDEQKEVLQDIRKALGDAHISNLREILGGEEEKVNQAFAKSLYKAAVQAIISYYFNGRSDAYMNKYVAISNKMATRLISYGSSEKLTDSLMEECAAIKASKELLNQMEFVLKELGKLKISLDRKIQMDEGTDTQIIESGKKSKIEALEIKIKEIKKEVNQDLDLLSPIDHSYFENKVSKFNTVMEVAIKETEAGHIGQLSRFLYDLWKKVTEALKKSEPLQENPTKRSHSLSFFATHTAKRLKTLQEDATKAAEAESSGPAPAS
ncbi:MAG: hypothetical protein WBE18_01910, partial [Gammaproteobacteria bacterium]